MPRGVGSGMVPPSPCTTRSRSGLSFCLTACCQVSFALPIWANGIRFADVLVVSVWRNRDNGGSIVSNEDRIAASRTVTASPAEVFRIVTDPAMHVEIDGSGMLQAAPGARRLEAPGDTFVMDMDREPLGDV